MAITKRIPNCTTKAEIRDQFDSLDDDQKQTIAALYAEFHYRTTSRNPDGTQRHADGSAGEIHITPKEMRDLLAYIAKHPIDLNR